MEKEGSYSYVFHFYGDKIYWDTSKTAAISVAYAHDAKGEGESEGNGGIKWYDFRLRKRLIKPFEEEFILKIDSILHTKHTEE